LKYADVPLGIFLVRGDNLFLIGELVCFLHNFLKLNYSSHQLYYSSLTPIHHECILLNVNLHNNITSILKFDIPSLIYKHIYSSLFKSEIEISKLQKVEVSEIIGEYVRRQNEKEREKQLVMSSAQSRYAMDD
jgi:hypothetical protein